MWTCLKLLLRIDIALSAVAERMVLVGDVEPVEGVLVSRAAPLERSDPGEIAGERNDEKSICSLPMAGILSWLARSMPREG